MSVQLYFDVHVPSAIADGLRLRGVDVLTAQEDGTTELEDPQLLDRTTELARVFFTQDQHLLREASRRHRAGKSFFGIVYAHQLGASIGECITDLEIIAKDSQTSGLAALSTCRFDECSGLATWGRSLAPFSG